jgi:hypothetical protein
MTIEVHRASIQISRPTAHDPGTVEQSCYFIEGIDRVVLCERDGTPLVRATPSLRRRGEPVLLRWERKIAPGEDHGRAARQLLWQKYSATRKGSDFNRPISMRSWGGVA